MSNDEGGGIMIAGQLPANRGDALARLRSGGHLQQPDPGQPGQRRRRRHPLPDGGQLPDERLQQHDRQQRVDPRGRRHRPQRRARTCGSYNNTIMKNLTTATAVTCNGAAGAGRPVDLGQQRPAAGHRCRAARRPSATRCCSTTSSGTTGPARGRGTTVTGHRRWPATPRPIDHWDLGRRRRHRPARADELGHPAERRRAPVHHEPDQQRRGPGGRRRLRRVGVRSRPGARTRRSSTRRWSTVDAPPEPAGRLPPGGLPGSPALQPRRGLQGGAAYQRPPSTCARRPTSTTRCARPWAASTPAPTSSAPRRRPRRRHGPLLLDRREHQPAGRDRHRRRRGHLPLERHGRSAGSGTPARVNVPTAPTSTASPGSTRRHFYVSFAGDD